MGGTARRCRVAVVGAAAAVAVACAADDRANPAAEHLADRAEAVADRIDAGDACGALALADQLVDRAWVTVSGGELPTATAAEVEATVAEVAAQLTCDDEVEALADAEDESAAPAHDAPRDHAAEDEAPPDDTPADEADGGAVDTEADTPPRTGNREDPENASTGDGEASSGRDDDAPARSSDTPGRSSDTPGRSSDTPGRSSDAPGRGSGGRG